MAKRKQLNKADEAFIRANLHLNSLEIADEINLEQDVIAPFLKAARKEAVKDPGRLKDSNGNVVGFTLTDSLADHQSTGETKASPPVADYIYRRKDKK